MISIRKYLDGEHAVEALAPPPPKSPKGGGDVLSAAVGAYRAALQAIGRASLEACAVTGPELDRELSAAAEKLLAGVTAETVASADAGVQKGLEGWGRTTARHFQEKAGEVKQILLVMAQTAESVGARDQRCAAQIREVTTNLKSIASLDDISEIRKSIERSAVDLKGSIDRMAAEGKAVLEALKTKVTNFEAKLEEAELAASTDGLTRLRNRLWVEGQLERKVAAGAGFCLAIVDIDGFKDVNDRHGHMVGDEVLKQFAGELKSVCRSGDMVGRWGGDEFVILLDCGRESANAQLERIRKWVCGSYKVEGVAGALKLDVAASIGLAEFQPPETTKDLLKRADAAMYAQKAAERSKSSSHKSKR